MEDDQGDDRSEAELGQVEGPLHARLLSVEEQRQPGARGRRPATYSVGGSRNRNGDAGQLAQRERVPLAQEVDVDDVGLAEEERQAASGHGRKNPSGNGGGGISRTTARYRIAATAAMTTVKPRTRTAGVSHGGATKRRRSLAPGRSIEAWELFSRAAAAIVTWVRWTWRQRQCPACGARTP